MECNPLAVQFIAAYSRQLDILVVWSIASLGFTLGAATLPQLGSLLGRGPTAHMSPLNSTLQTLAAVALLASLALYYFANNMYSQAIPELCTLHLRPEFNSRKFISATTFASLVTNASDAISTSLTLMRWQYVTFGGGIFLIVCSVISNLPWKRRSMKP